MKKTSLSMRILAMVLVLIMTVQIIPANVFAFGELKAADTGIKVDTIKKEDVINWPIKIYDYLNDGLLFEYSDNNYTGTVTTGYSDAASIVPYGGGEHPVVTAKGTDYTYNGAVTETDYNVYNDSIVEAVDFQCPRHLHIAGKGDSNTSNGNYTVASFSATKQADMRYIVLVYRGSGISGKDFSLTFAPNWNRTKSGVYLADSSTWRYEVIDLDEWFAGGANQFSAATEARITFGFHAKKRGLPSGAWFDLSHVAYFTDEAEAHNYGQAAAAFDNNPGEYLKHSSESFTATTTTVNPSSNLRENYLFSLYWNWKNANDLPEMGDANSTNVYYGMDFTTTSKTEGEYVNAYTTNSYWTWESGASQTYKYTQNGVIGTNTFAMDAIDVQQKSESNGAMYVRLTNDGPSRILLSKFREDLTKQADTFVPETSGVNYAVLVYRANHLEDTDHYAFWAQGYDASSANADFTSASNWKYAGLVSDSAAWADADSINKLSFLSDSGWQYAVVPLTETIGAKDSDMNQITRLCRTGLYLPELSDGKSLDLAYAVYFSSEDQAEVFGKAAVEYMKSEPKVTTSTTTKSYGSSRVWNSGNNKGFGMLRATGGGNWATKYNGGSSTDSFGYDTWFLGYDTGSYWGSGGNATGYRRNPVTGELYDAQYTTTGSKIINQNATGYTNEIYFINTYSSSNDGLDNGTNVFDTSVLDFDGYELLETIAQNGVLTVGLLEGSLRTVRIDDVEYRVPVYRQETVEYIAYLVLNALKVPKRDSKGNYNTAFVCGAKSTAFGGVDLNGDGEVGMINLDGDSRTGTNGNECDENTVDLATALRHCLGITLPIGADKGVGGTLGTYEETLKKDAFLMGKFSDCRYSIKTAMDAAYYMLNSLFIANSFNQKQDDYYYLQMPSATLDMDGRSGTAYVFDAGFTIGKIGDLNTNNGEFTDDGTNQSAIHYSPAVDANNNPGTGTIYMEGVTGKTHFNYSTDGTSWTTRFPFLPVTDAEGDFASGTDSYYFLDDGVRRYYVETGSYFQPNADAANFTANRRNYHYVMASNGEFVYKENDNLFFDFEGDDDVYLFINGELVMDNGAAHSITGVYIDVNDYVYRAREEMAKVAVYGYTSDMTAEEFDELIDAEYLDKYTYDANGKINGTESVKNPFSEDEIRELKRWARLDLVDGQTCQFDFYYMERHGWGANMRIVTNMHITDPSLDADKTAYQYGQEIEYGGVIDPTASLEYNFSLTNSGNQKLYNLTFKDEVIGLTLDPTNGLTFIADENGKNKNGIYILDGTGHSLEAKDLTAVVSGYNAIGQYTEVVVTFPEVDGDGGQTALKRFLHKLQSEETESDQDDAEVTHAGSGLWVDATVTIKGIHYMLTPDQMKAGSVNNVVYLTATTRTDPNVVGSQTLRSDAEHLIYTSGFPVHYQWAGHNIFIKMEHLLEESKKEAGTEGTQLSLYSTFFNSVDDLDDIYYNLCDKYGRTGGYYAYHTKTSDKAGNPGYLVNYDEPGIYTFYLLLYKREGVSRTYLPEGEDAEDIASGEYAIIRSQVYVADVEDSVYVLDYGLSTESLDVGGELFKNDHLFGPYGTIRAKLMGVTGTQPSYLDPAVTNDTDYCRISFQRQNLSAANTITTPDGIYKVNLAIPDSGKLISYDSATGEYTLTGVGTTKISAIVPTEDNWEQTFLYYWYDDGTSGPAWPGTPMKSLGGGQFEIDIPSDVSNVIINNGSGALQTADLKITPGLEATITVQVDNNNEVTTDISTIVEEVKIHVKVPDSWEKVYLHHWYDNGETTEFPGEEITEKDENGYWVITVYGDVTHMLVNNGANHQSGDLNVYAGREAWIEVSDNVSGTMEGTDGVVTTYHEASIKYTLSEGYDVHASVPNSWNDTVYIYYWRSDNSKNAEWPGEPMKKGEFGWYSYVDENGNAKKVPYDVTNIIINDGNDEHSHQTVDLTVTPGLETWIMVNNTLENGKYTAKVAYGSETSSTGLTFTPKDFMDQANNLWLAITVHSTSANPSKLNTAVDIHNETQMYKKISVIPASVVYYEDTFGAVNYNKNDANSNNSFTHHGNGSGQLSQSIDQDQPYGQDAAYQGGENDQYSGGSLTEVEILDDSVVATFTFKGTGFELISRTTAFDSGSFMARVYKKSAYSATAYDDYMKDAQAYLAVMTKNLNISNAYSDAYAAWEQASAKYQEALAAYNEAKAAYEAAAAKADDTALLEEYVTKFAAAYTAFEAYEKARQDYAEKLSEYEKALQEHTKKDSEYAVCTELGGCSFTYDEELTAFETALVLGAMPTAPVAGETLVTITQPTKPTSPCVTMAMVYTQFDHGNNGGTESINQVPALRVNGLDLGEYVVEVAGLPTYTFDDQYEINGVQPTNLYIDGIRIYQPIGYDEYLEENEKPLPYNDKEYQATVEELRDLIANGTVGVATMGNTGLNVSSGTTTWTESLNDNDFDASNKETYNSIKVENTADYLIQGPNNEVYMEGNVTNSAMIFYVKETGTGAHELQIAVRGLDYGKYYGAGSTGVNAQLQYGILTKDGYAWKNLVQIKSGTEQYYTIPYAECPVDSQGRYQIVLRAINPLTQSSAMVSYTNLKRNGLTIEKVEGVGEGSIIYYQNGILVKPDYELVIVEDSSFKDVEVIPFTGSELTINLTRDLTYVFIRSTLNGKVDNYYAAADPGPATSAIMDRFLNDGTQRRFTLDVPKGGGEVTFKIKQTNQDSLQLSYCLHTYGEGAVTREPNCSITGIMTYQCTKCDHIKREHIATNDTHHYSGGICVYCGAQEDKYYLVGYINGKNHGWDWDYENMGDYLFVDGKLTVEFEKDSYVFLKADGNAAWYMTPAYATEDTATFYDTSTGAYTEKMYVPCGVKLVFTLTVNDDGSLTLHYEEPCNHSWDEGQITVKATCTTDGEKTYTCSKCLQTKVESIPATGHNYVNGVCSNGGCGEIEYRTIYFKNTAGWEKVYVYAKNPTNNVEYTSRWPGDEMQLVEGETNIYSVNLPTYLKVNFNNGTGTETGDLDIPAYGDMYDYSISSWVNRSGMVDYYLVGFINGADYGIGESINSMGSYKFVNGKLNVTFDKESYVMVKAIGNTAFYYTQEYCETYNATLYNGNTGANEKMFIPGGTEIEFTLTVNDDGTLNLAAHSWFSVVSKEPTCTEAGEKTYTCYLCNDSYAETVPATGHNFVDNECTVCGVDEMITVYFKNTAGWENVYIYAFTEGTPATEYAGDFPGTEMSLVEGETDLYYFEVNAKAKSVIFSNGIGVQTQNLHAPNGENNKYTYGANVWTPVDEEVEVPDQKIYLKADEWLVDSAWLAAYFFEGDQNTWAKMTDTDGDGIYECVIPEGYTNVIFCRMNKDRTDLSWDSKWNQTVDLTIPTDGKNFFTITNPWNGQDDKGTGEWSVYTCDHSYSEEVTTEPGCESVGVKTFTCSKCGDHYTEEIEALGHNYVNGSCTVCGGKDPAYVTKVYLQPGSEWEQADAWFAAWFTGVDTWAKMTDSVGNGYYQCAIPDGATGVVFVRMNPAVTEPSWNDNEKWNQTVDLTVEADRLYVIEDPWASKATGSWTDYNASVAECEHSYAEEVTTEPGCESVGVKTFTCSKCGDQYTEEIAALGHKFENGVCVNGCGTTESTEPAEPVILYLKPNDNWNQSDARFAAYFFIKDGASTWVDMTDSDGDGIYECEALEGYPNVIFVRMNPGTTENNWTNKWNQTADLTMPTGDKTLFTVPDGTWDGADDTNWSAYTAAASFSLRSTKKTTETADATGNETLPDIYIYGDENKVLNLSAINAQMSSDVIYGQPEQFLPGDEPEDAVVDIHSAALVLSDDIIMNYYVTVPENAENVYMTFLLNGKVTTVTDYTVCEDGRYCFRFTGINAKKMGDNICATLYASVDGAYYTDCVEEFSVRTYCAKQLKKYPDDAELVRLISDLLVYGAKDQLYSGYKTDELVTDGLDLNPSAFSGLDQGYNKLEVRGESDKNVRYSAVTLILDSKVIMCLTVKTDDPSAYTYTVSTCGKTKVYTAEDLVYAGDGKYELYFDGLKATGFNETVTATIQRDGQNISQMVTYSVNSYVYKNQNVKDDALRELVQAIYNYGNSAYEYFN